MLENIEYFKIIGLHGHLNYNLQFKDNRLILVGENGTGKTTVLRIFFYFLTMQWHSIIMYNFTRISIQIGSTPFTIKKQDIVKEHEKLKNNYGMFFSETIYNNLLANYEKNIATNPKLLKDFFGLMGSSEFLEIQEKKTPAKKKNKLNDHSSYIHNNFKPKILYLPTYRRIEDELKSIFKNDDNGKERNKKTLNQSSRFIELVEFGMKDVECLIQTMLENLKEFAREKLNQLSLEYLEDVIGEEYEKINILEIKSIKEETIEDILSRVPEGMLSDEQKPKLKREIIDIINSDSLSHHNKVVCHYFSKLLSFQNLLIEKESRLKSFVDICNSYFVENKFIYNHKNFSLKILLSKTDEEISLSSLSSGEKQIASLFSHLYLSDIKNAFIIIDEPELSLSVPWQRKFLEDISNGHFCRGFLVVTHSPFIYDNTLMGYAHGIGEYMKHGEENDNA